MFNQFGISANRPNDFQLIKSQQDRLDELLSLDKKGQVIHVSKHYLKNFIPLPIENEDLYWMCTCFPGNNFPAVRFNIYWHEVMNISPSNEITDKEIKWELMVFTDSKFTTDKTVSKLKKTVDGLYSDEDYRYDKGLLSQRALFFPIDSYDELVKNEMVFEGIRQYNIGLSEKGKRVHTGHNYPLARYLFQK